MPRTDAGRGGAPGALLSAVAQLVAGVVALASVQLLWQVVVSWWQVLRGRDRTLLPGAPTTRFLVLVPAHDEASGIGDTLDSLSALDYPAALFEVHVVADHCTDATADVVRAHGHAVHPRDDHEPPGKGPALTWLRDRLADVPHDALVVVDADTLVDPAFLRVMDAHLAAGEEVVQGHYAVRDPDTSPAVALRAAALAPRHYLRPLARTALGGTSGLHGNGMAFSARVLAERPWTGHLVEDLEFEAGLVADGGRVGFAPDARVAAEMPARLEDAVTQHERWERGRLEVARDHALPLLRAAATTPGGRWRKLDLAVDHLLPPLSLLVAASAAGAGLAAAAHLVRRSAGTRRATVLAGGALATQVAYVVSGLLQTGAPPTVWRGLRAAPALVVWKLGLLRRVAGDEDVAWTRTERNA